MAELRRVELVSSTPLADDKKKVERLSTVRLTVSLTESNDTSCPEFSYTDMLFKNAPNDPDADLDSNDPFSAKDKMEHDKLLAIGRAFEAKYATKQGKRKNPSGRRKLDVRDLVDLGDGYDETDGFIDNTEAYDEYVPKTLTTKFGGFYINIGLLDFREVSDNEDVENGTDESHDLLPRKKKFKRHRILSDSENPDPDRKERKKKHNHLKENSIEEKVLKKKKRLNSNMLGGEKIKKRPPGRPPKVEKRLISELLGDGDNPESAAAKLNLERDVSEISIQKPQTVSEGLPQQIDKITSVDSANAMATTNVDKVPTNCFAPSSSGDSQAVTAEAPSLVEMNSDLSAEPNLPSSMPPKLCTVIDELKLASKQTSEGRLFTTEVNRLLLQIEIECRQLPNSIKASVFMHLAKSMRCEKEFLIKRSKKLILSHYDEKLKKPIALLREAVQKVMPALIERHRSDVSAIEQLRRERISECGKDFVKRDSAEPGKDLARRDGGTGSDSDENGLEDNAEVSTPSNGERQKRIMAPRKKFEWTLQLRALLNNIVSIKMEQFEMSKIRMQTAEEYLKTFFEAELKLLWPAGWMQARMLFKESREAHFRWTTGVPKPKKLMLVAGTAPGSKTSTPAGQEFRENHISASPCVTPIAKSELRPTVAKHDITAHQDVVVLDDSLTPIRTASKLDNVKDSKLDLSLEHSKKVSFCPNIHVVQLPSESQSQSNDSRRLQTRCQNGTNAMSVKLEDSVELCRGSSKSDSYDGFLCDTSVELAEKCSKQQILHDAERSSRTSPPQLDIPSRSVVGSSLSVDQEKFSSESCNSLNLFSESYETGASKPVGNQMNQSLSGFGEKFTEFLEQSVKTNKVKPRGYHLREPTAAAQFLAASASSTEGSVNNLNDATDLGQQNSRVYSREYCDKVQMSPVKNSLQSAMLPSINTVGPFDCSRNLHLSSPTKNSSRPTAAIHAVSAARSNTKHLDGVNSRVELSASSFPAATCVGTSDVHPVVRPSCSRSSVTSTARQHPTSASPPDTRDVQNPAAWYPWSEWNPRLDVASREQLVQSLMNDSMEQRRKTLMSCVGKMQSMPLDSNRPLGTMTGELHKTTAKVVPQSYNVPAGATMAQHGRQGDNRQSAQATVSTSPKISSVSPQQRSLLLPQKQHTGQYFNTSMAQLTQADYQSQPGSSAAAVRATEMLETGGLSSQRQPNMAAAAIMSSSAKNYGQSSLAVSGNGKTSFVSRSHQSSAELSFPVTGRHSSGSHATYNNLYAGSSSAGTLSTLSTPDVLGVSSSADVSQNCSVSQVFRTNPLYAMHHANDVPHTSPR